MHRPIHIIIIDHPRSGVVGVYNFGSAVCLSVCMSVRRWLWKALT